jgi:protoporphyrinogen oxidase
MASCRVAILGAGPAGVGAAYQLTRLERAKATVIERGQHVGGLAGSFNLAGFNVDFGSHRLHPACDPAVLDDIRRLLGGDLLDRPRHGRIRLRGRWIHFPLKPVDLIRRLPLGFACGATCDLVKKAWPFSQNGVHEASFASVLQRGLGATICRDFYFPYARKIWGLDPDQLSAIQARRRVRAGSLGKLIKKILAAVPGLKPRGGGRFYYPRQGYGQITQRYFEAARDQGAQFLFGSTVEAVHVNPGMSPSVEFHTPEGMRTLPCDFVWSTIPITMLAKRVRPEAPSEVLEAADRIHYRGMILIYLLIAQQRFSEFDAHYFPETDIPITRMSEPRNYSTAAEPSDRTVLCAELPCAKGDAHWNMPDAQLGEVVQGALARLGIPITGPVLEVTTRRLPQAYPVYQQGYEAHFDRIDRWLGALAPVLTLGRQGLFAHDNTHHTLAMAYAAVDCLDDQGRFDTARWQQYRTAFESHVVED